MKYLENFDFFKKSNKKEVADEKQKLSFDDNFFKSIKEQHPDFENIGYDDDNNVLGNCKKCGAKGTFVIGHKCKVFNESKEVMTDKDRRAVTKKVKADIKDNKDYKDLLPGQKETFQDKLITKYCKELGFKLSDFYAGDGKKINKLLENREEREGTFDYFMTKSKEELLEYEKNFKHSFENPAEHDPKFVAWKKACEVKKCFPKDENKGFRGIQEPGPRGRWSS